MSEHTTKEIDIWTEVINPQNRDMTEAEAHALLRWQFSDRAKQRMEELATRNGQGTLTTPDKEELEAYMHVGQVIAILQAKARLGVFPPLSADPEPS
jgi:hypothetical protein